MSTDKTEQALNHFEWVLTEYMQGNGSRDGVDEARHALRAALTAAPPAQQQSDPTLAEIDEEARRICEARANRFGEDARQLWHFYSAKYREEAEESLRAATPPSPQEPQEAGDNV